MARPAKTIEYHSAAHRIAFEQPVSSMTKTVWRGLGRMIAAECKWIGIEMNRDAIERKCIRFDDIERKVSTHAVKPRRKTVLKTLLALKDQPIMMTTEVMDVVGVSKTTALQLMRLIPRLQKRLVEGFLNYRLCTPLVLTPMEEEKYLV